jgi:hypothetical protein
MRSKLKKMDECRMTSNMGRMEYHKKKYNTINNYARSSNLLLLNVTRFLLLPSSVAATHHLDASNG